MNNAMTQATCGSTCGCATGITKATVAPLVTGFFIGNMDCPSEEAQIRKRLAQIDGIQDVVFDLPAHYVEVVHEPAGQNAILRALHDIGMQAVVQPRSSQLVYLIQQMDCPSEERQLRATLEPLEGVQKLDFDLKAHTLTVSHTLTDTTPIAQAIVNLGMQPVEKTAGSMPIAVEALPPRMVASSIRTPVPGNGTRFLIPNMDCPTEEATIRKRLGAINGIERLDFNLMGRRLDVLHH